MSSVSTGSFGAAFAPLQSTFGSRLTVHRDGSAVCWMLDGLAAHVEPIGQSAVRVTFIDRTSPERSSEAATAHFHTASGYALTSEGARRLATDLTVFFKSSRAPITAIASARTDGYVRA